MICDFFSLSGAAVRAGCGCTDARAGERESWNDELAMGCVWLEYSTS